MNVPFGHKQAAVLNILVSDKGYLLLRRDKEPNRGLYTPVGGKIDAFETPAEAARRETLEETGIEVNAGSISLAGVLVDTSPTANNWVCFVYVTPIDFADPGHCDEGLLEWISEERLSEVPIPVSDRFVFQFVHEARPFVISAVYNDQDEVQLISEELSNTIVYRINGKSAS